MSFTTNFKHERSQLLVDRFWSRVDKSDNSGCWLWTGGVQRNYGGIGVPHARRTLKAHRLSWEIAHECLIPAGMWVLHSCDTPLCVNPAHLRLGTRADNSQDMVDRKRSYFSQRTHCPHGHAYDAANTLVSDGRRFCRACNRIATNKRRRIEREIHR